MKSSAGSHALASLTGGVVVAICFVAFGIAGRRTTQPIIEESPAAGGITSGRDPGLTLHEIYVRDAPAVVFVRAVVTTPVQSPFELRAPRPDSTSSGSGFLVTRTGLVLTAYHLIEGSDPSSGITVQFQDSGARPAVLIAENADEDLAVLRVDMHGLPAVRPIPIGDSATVKVGDATLALANPFGLERTLSSGIVSALQPLIETPDGFRLDDVIQTGTATDPGSNGGPLLDADGRAIGVTSQIEAAAASGDGTAPVAFAVPIDTAKQLLPPAGRRPSPASASLGVSAAAAAAAAGSRSTGVVVNVAPGGPAAVAGLKGHEAIEAIDGRPVDAISQLQAIVQERMPGAPVWVTVRHGRRLQSVRIVLGANPASNSP